MFGESATFVNNIQPAGQVFQSVDHPATGPYPIAGVPFRLSETPCCIRSPAPTLGQHSEMVLKQHLGLSDAEYASLEGQGITGDDPDED